jgi:hypothetical protein
MKELITLFRRIGQQNKGWSNSIDIQDYQLSLIKRLYAKNGLEINRTCAACPEQYEVFKDRIQVAYYRLRNGEFRVDYPDCGGETIYEAEPIGDGIFESRKRLIFLNKAMKVLINKI